MRASKALVALSWIVASALTTGCAFKNQEVHLEHPAATYAGPKGRGQQVTLSLLSDARDDKRRVGVVKNGYGWETADVVTQDNVAVVISNAVKTDLEAAGFKVERALGAAAATDTAIVVGGAIAKVMAEPKVGLWSADVVAEVVVDVELSLGGRSHTRKFVGKGLKTAMVTTADDFKQTLDRAIADVTAQIARACVEALSGNREAARGKGES